MLTQAVQAAELKELKEFTTKLKSLPQIQRHIELLSAVQTVSGRAGFRERVSMEQAILDAAASDAAALFIEVCASLMPVKASSSLAVQVLTQCACRT